MKPYIIYHMTCSLNMKITGSFLTKYPEASELYYQLHRQYRQIGAGGFICGRTTMQSSFLHGECFAEKNHGMVLPREDFIADAEHDFYAVAIDTHGKLPWKENVIHDEDPGYDDCHIIEVLCENVSDSYLQYLQEKKISYIFAGKETLDMGVMLEKLNRYFGMRTVLLEGGGIIGGSFEKEGMIDELSLVVVPYVESEHERSLFANLDTPALSGYHVQYTEKEGDIIILHYTKEESDA